MSRGTAYAIVREEPPRIYLAEDIEILQRVLAVELVARTAAKDIEPGLRDVLRTALLEERWADAVLGWISYTDIEVDVYTHSHVFSAADLPPETIGAQLQFTPLFRD